MVETVGDGGRAGDGDEVNAVLGAAGAVDLTVVEVEVPARGVELLVVTGAAAALVVTGAADGTVVGGSAVVVLLGRVTNAKGVGVGGRDTPSGG